MSMTETTVIEEAGLDSSGEETVEWSMDVPQFGEFVPCDTCESRSYAFVLVGESMLSYCGHHFSKYEKNLTAVGAVLADYRDRIGGIRSEVAKDSPEGMKKAVLGHG